MQQVQCRCDAGAMQVRCRCGAGAVQVRCTCSCACGAGLPRVRVRVGAPLAPLARSEEAEVRRVALRDEGHARHAVGTLMQLALSALGEAP